MPSLAELTDYYDQNNPDIQLSTGEGVPTRITVRPEPRPEPDGRSIRQKLMGEFGERYQLWPEKIVREGLSAAGDVFKEGTVLPGLRREDITDIPKLDMPTKDSTWLGKLLALAPVAAQPGDSLIEKAQAISALAGTGGLAGTTDATLGATPFLRPALKYKDKLYKGKEGQQHQDIIPKELYPEFEQMAMNGEDISHYNFGFVNEKGHFLDREKALEHAINNGLVDPIAGQYGALTSTLMADSSKPGTAIEAMSKTGVPAKDFLKTLDAHDATLPKEAQSAISKFVGGPHDTFAKGIESGIMNADPLEVAYGAKSKYMTGGRHKDSALVKQQLEAAAAPIREALRKEHGDTITLYRTQGEIPKDAQPRKVLSMTADEDFAHSWAGVKKVRGLYTDEEIQAARKKLDETGEAEAGNYILKKSEHSPKYYDLHSKKGEYLTDSGGPEELLTHENEWLKQLHATNADKSKKVGKYEVPVDNVMWYTNRFGQKEFIVKNDENLRKIMLKADNQPNSVFFLSDSSKPGTAIEAMSPDELNKKGYKFIPVDHEPDFGDK